jgi:hypothetical protein
MENILLEGPQTDRLSIIATGLSYKEGSKPALEGKTFSRLRFEGIVLTLDDSHPFMEDFNNGKVYSITLNKTTRVKKVVGEDGKVIEESVPSLEFDSYGTKKQRLAWDDFDVKRSRIKKLSELPLTEAVLEDLA